MKLKDFREQLRSVDVPEPPRALARGETGRHPSGALFTGIDLGAEPARTGIVIYERQEDTTLKVVYVTGMTHDLHDVKATIVDLSQEYIQPRASSDMPSILGESFKKRFERYFGSPMSLSPGFGPSEHTIRLGAQMAAVMEKGRISEPVARAIERRRIKSALRGEEAPEEDTASVADYLVFIDSQYRQPMLSRLVAVTQSQGEPTLVVQANNDHQLHRGHAAAFYPAETVPCFACKQTGKNLPSAGASPSWLVGKTCTSCNGLGRVWRHRIWAHPEASGHVATRGALHFAEANPKRWGASLA